MREVLIPQRPLQWVIIFFALWVIVVVVGGTNFLILSQRGVKLATGALLLIAMSYQSLILWKKFQRRSIGQGDLTNHRRVSFLSLGLIFLHLSGPVHAWYSFLLLSFTLAAVSAYFARSMVKPRSRVAVMRQVSLHTISGAIAIAAAIPHSVLSLLFE